MRTPAAEILSWHRFVQRLLEAARSTAQAILPKKKAHRPKPVRLVFLVLA